jgi:hypothetical protein
MYFGCARPLLQYVGTFSCCLRTSVAKADNAVTMRETVAANEFDDIKALNSLCYDGL